MVREEADEPKASQSVFSPVHCCKAQQAQVLDFEGTTRAAVFDGPQRALPRGGHSRCSCFVGWARVPVQCALHKVIRMSDGVRPVSWTKGPRHLHDLRRRFSNIFNSSFFYLEDNRLGADNILSLDPSLDLSTGRVLTFGAS